MLWTLDTRTEPLVEKAVAVSESLLDANWTLGNRMNRKVLHLPHLP
jgi:hypothetical protein